MNAQELDHLQTLLSSPGPIPEPSRAKLLDLVETARSQLSPDERKAERDAIIKNGVESLDVGSKRSRARLLAAESKRLHRGRRSAYSWVNQADRICRLPESERMFEKILSTRSKATDFST